MSSFITAELIFLTDFLYFLFVDLSHILSSKCANQCKDNSTTMQPMVGGKLSKSEKSYPNAREMRAPESVQLKEK